MKNLPIFAVAILLFSSGAILVGSSGRSMPFEEHPVSLPGRLEVENFDLGGEGAAYHDTDAINHGNGKGNLEEEAAEAAFRREEGVDLSFTKSPDSQRKGDLGLDGKPVPPGSLYVGWTAPGEWMRYTVEVERAGRYRISGQVSSREKGGDFELHFDANDEAATVILPKTGSAHVWTTAQDLGEITLEAGVQTMTLRIGAAAGFNLDWLRFTRIPDTMVTQAKLDFNREIRPILADQCFDCHGPDEHGRKADLRLDLASAAHEYAIVPGDPEASPFVERLLSHDEDDIMPPPESPRQPSRDEIAKLVQWIEEGAEYDDHWSFVKPKQAEIPAVSDSDWVRNEIDSFVLNLLEKKGKTPRRDAFPGVLARRLSLVLTGLPVMPAQLAGFKAAYAADPDKAIEGLVDELLASPAFGEHYAWTWLDAARYADTNGYQSDGTRVMWPWRDWLIETLNRNVPYDEMTRQMLAGDLLIDSEWETAGWIPDAKENELLLATGFLRNHRYDTGSGTIPEESKFENAADRMETVGTVWMGMTMQCAKCHTHKYDPIEQREYYEMISLFDNVPELGSALKDASHPYIHTPLPDQRAKLEAWTQELTEKREELQAVLAEHANDKAAWEKVITESGEVALPKIQRGLQYQFVPDGKSFDGTNQVKKTNEPIAMITGDREWTISFWFRPDSEEDGAIFSSVEEPDRYRQGIQADWIDQKIRIRRVARWVNSYIEFESTVQIKVGEWVHVTFRSDGRMQGIGHYASLNGDESAMLCTHEVTNDSTTRAGRAALVLGGSSLLDGVKGGLRDLRFYDRNLADGEVMALAETRPLAMLAGIPVAERTVAESATLEVAFTESDFFPDKAQKLSQGIRSLEEQIKALLKEAPTTMVMQEAETGQTFIRPTGTYDTKANYVSNGVPAFLTDEPLAAPDRLEFADWLMQPDHPLTGRVAVNRIWQFLWGRGLVDSPENFGIQTPEPIHSELLDWLAVEYANLGWDTKALIKLIVTSRTFRQDSGASDDLWSSDPFNHYLARGPRYRLPVQTVRDQALYLSGRLDDTIGGPPVLIDPVKAKDERIVKLPYELKDDRRTLYTFWKRNGAHPMLAVFDVVDRNQCDVRKPRTNTPLQALVTLNQPGLVESAREFGKRMREAADEESDQLRWGWEACTGRPPGKREAGRLAWSLKQYRKAAGGDEDTAWTAIANVMLNLDATLSVE